jgi:hypothetical protein
VGKRIINPLKRNMEGTKNWSVLVTKKGEQPVDALTPSPLIVLVT